VGFLEVRLKGLVQDAVCESQICGNPQHHEGKKRRSNPEFLADQVGISTDD
jgi:hypothetical protein